MLRRLTCLPGQLRQHGIDLFLHRLLHRAAVDAGHLLPAGRLAGGAFRIAARRLDLRQALFEPALQGGELAARIVERAPQRPDFSGKLGHGLAPPLEFLRQGLALTVQPEREFRRLCLDRRDLFLDLLETRRAGLEAFRQSVHAPVQIRQAPGQHVQSVGDRDELALERGGALTQSLQRLAEVAVLTEQLALWIGFRTVAERRHGAQRPGQQLVELVDICSDLGLQRAESLLPRLGGPDPHLERRALVRRLLDQAVLQRGQILLHARAHAQLLIVRRAEQRATQRDDAEDQGAEPKTDTRLAARRLRRSLLGLLLDTCALLPDSLIGEADQVHDVRLELRHARRVAIRSGACAFELSKRGDVLAILREQPRLSGKRRPQTVFHGG